MPRIQIFSPQIQLVRKIDMSGDGCWPWLGARDKDGYGIFSFWDREARKHRTVRASRYWYEIVFCRRIPHGYMVCHKCDNPPCMNPNDFFLGTNQDNQRDSIRKGRNTRTKLSAYDIYKIRELSRQGFSQKLICEQFQITSGHVSQIINLKARME